ncbi:NERD domain-containing protein [Streptomyces nitrosporeus]|uniref:NERD domain-containing protein n=1 Tax=Streptomyces nitrosporeus TaxID=28894 RepID=UPI00399EF415
MQDLKVTSWQLFGHDRLYVNLPDGTAIGWADLGSGTITVLHPSYRDAVTDALARQVPDIPPLGETEPPAPPAPPPPAPRIPPLRRMRKRAGAAAPGGAARPVQAVRVPEQAAAPRQEQHTEQSPEPCAELSSGFSSGLPSDPPAGLSSGQHAGQPLRKSPEQPPEQPLRQPPEQPLRQSPEQPSDQSSPEQSPKQQAPSGRPGPAPRRTGLPALTPATDLAVRRPGTALREQLGESGAAGALVRAATGALRRTKEPDARRTALAGERRVGAELRRLTRHGWRVLHSVPLPDGGEIGHLLIGPGGVFAVHAEHRPQASVRIGDGTVRVGDGEPLPYALDDRFGAGRAQAVLEAHCAFPVPVGTVVVFAGVTALEVVTTPPGVRVLRERQVSSLAPLSGVLTPTQVERVYDVARNREAWADA